jgi:hypothetical protein
VDHDPRGLRPLGPPKPRLSGADPVIRGDLAALIQLLVGQGRYDDANAVMQQSRSPHYRIHRGD